MQVTTLLYSRDDVEVPLLTRVRQAEHCTLHVSVYQVTRKKMQNAVIWNSCDDHVRVTSMRDGTP